MRIIDDVLTLSKLDSMVLSVVPVDVQIHESVSQVMKIFHSELQVKGISSKYLVRLCRSVLIPLPVYHGKNASTNYLE